MGCVTKPSLKMSRPLDHGRGTYVVLGTLDRVSNVDVEEHFFGVWIGSVNGSANVSVVTRSLTS